MATIIGSARIDENGHAHGGQAGDQKQTSKPDYKGEVSQQEFYAHSKGWYIFRTKKIEHANKLAKCMIRACNNKNIGYDQWQRDNIVRDHTNSKTPTECDCSSLVRECIIEATGIDPGNIRTVDMPYMLPETGLFKTRMSWLPGVKLYTGDILVTKTSGHTVIVTQGLERTKDNKDKNPIVAEPVLKKGSKGTQVKYLQKDLNFLHMWGPEPKLVLDGEFGPKTDAALRKFQKKYNLEVDGIYGPKSYAKMKELIE